MHHENLPMEMWYHLFGEFFITVTLLDGLTVIEKMKNVHHCTNILWRNAEVSTQFVHSGRSGYSHNQDRYHTQAGGPQSTLYVRGILPNSPYRVLQDVQSKNLQGTCIMGCHVAASTVLSKEQ